MNSRMDKYGIEKPEFKSRTELFEELYQNNEIDDISKIDLNSNISVLKTDAKNINIDLIREMLDKKYRDNIPKRKSISIDIEDNEEETNKEKIDTKEYDINEILAKAKTEQSVDYNKERLKKISNTNYEILKNLELDSKNKDNSEQELMTLINTITKLELENQEKGNKDARDLLDLGDTIVTTSDNTDEKKSELEEEEEERILENSFYTGNLAVEEKDFEDFKEIQKDIKSNSVIIKILVVLFVLIVLAVAVYLLNKYLNWGLF